MIYKCVVVLTILELVLGSPYWNQKDERTVAFEPEYDHTMGVQKAAFEHAYLKYKADIDETGPSGKTSSDGNIHHDLENYRRYLLEKEQYSSPLKNDEPKPDEPEIHEEDPRFKPFESDSAEDGQHRKEEYDEPRFYKHDQYEYVQFRSPLPNKGTSNSPSFTLITQNTGSYPHQYKDLSSSQDVARHRRSIERYEGPPAPLNEDLTVDFTPEIKHITEAHLAAIDKEYKRLHATAALAAAYPDRTSPPSKDYNPQINEQHNLFVPHPHHQGLNFDRKRRSYTGQYSPQQPSARHYDDGQYRPHLHKHDNGQYMHHHHKHDDGQYKPNLHKHDAGQYKPHLHQVVDYNTVPFRPAPLNADGTVAHIPEYQAIAASHLAAHHNVPSSVTY